MRHSDRDTRNSRRIFGVVFAIIAAIALIGAWAGGAFGQTLDHKGIYIASPILNSPKDGVSPEAYQVQGIDGGSIRIPWRVLEPSQGQYDWSILDREVDKIVAANGRFTLGILAGANSPKWLADAGAKVASFEIEKSETRPCASITMPVPWDRIAMRALVSIHRAAMRHLEAKGVADRLVMVKIPGLTVQQTLELRLPRHDGRPRTQRDGSLAPCQPSNALVTWAEAGYRPTLVANAWTAVAVNLSHIFDTQLLVVPFLESSASFPAIDDDGNRVPRRKVDLSDRIIWRCIDLFASRCGVQHSALRLSDDTDVSPRAMTYGAAGAPIVMQTNLFGGREGAGCQKDRHSPQEPCTSDGYRDLLIRGIEEGADALEIWQADALRFKDEVGTVKGRL